MNKHKSSSSIISRRSLAIVLIAGVFALLLGLWIWQRHSHKSSSPIPSSDATLPTGSHTKNGMPVKDGTPVPKPSKTTSDKSSNSKKEVVPKIVSTSVQAKSIAVRAQVGSIFEDGGRCTATLTKSDKTVSKSTTGFENVSYTQCQPINLTVPSSGSWTLVVSYSSKTAEGSSAKQVVEVN